MPLEREDQSLSDLVRTLLDDVRHLFREEVALAKAEIRQELDQARAAVIGLAAGVVLALIGVVMLCLTAGRAIAYGLGWPVLGGYAIVGAVLLLIGFGALMSGQRKLQRLQTLPHTTEALQENAQWAGKRMSSKS